MVDLGLECKQEMQLLRRAHADSILDFRISGDTYGSFDASRVRQALSNLVSNAAHHSPAGTVVKVEVKGNEDVVSVSTENEGAKIPEATLHTLFEPLRRHRVEFERSSEHLGLGLFVVREVVRAHHGDVSIMQNDGRIRFTMTLPKAVNADGPAVAASAT